MAANTAILMSDNRPPILTHAGASSLTYPLLAFSLNALYACTHGYDLLYYQMVSSECIHRTQGTRHASYCKLPAIAHALETYSTVVFIDSDSFFLHRNMSIPALLRQYAAPPSVASVQRASALFANDLPQLGERPNGGFHVWRRSDASSDVDDARRVLRSWWHLPAGRYATEHDYEQHSLQWQLSQLTHAVPLMHTLQLRAMADEFRHAVAHIDHTKAGRRLWVMAIELIKAAREVPAASPAGINAKAVRRLLRQARNVSPTAEPAPALLERALHAAAEQLRLGFDAVPSAGMMNTALFGANGLRCKTKSSGHGQGQRSPAPSRLHAFTYNASVMALRTLPLRSLLPAEGLPLTLEICQSAETTSLPGESNAAVLQRWRSTKSGRWQLASRPDYCLGIGPRKAPKRPYPILAQLQRCNSADNQAAASSQSRSNTDGDALQALDYSSADSRLRSRLPISPMRAALAAAAIRLRQSPATAESLASHSAIGRQLKQRKLEPRGSHRNFKKKAKKGGKHAGKGKRGAKRGKAPFWQDGSLASTESSALANDRSGGQLCLSAWRGQLSVGANLVFVLCDADDQSAKAQHVDALGGGATSDGLLLKLGDGQAGPLCVSALDQGVEF